MATATPYRWAKSAPPGSTLCPYCEVVYTRGGGSHCPTCGTKLLALQQRLVTVGGASLPPAPPALVRPEPPPPRATPQPEFVRGFVSAAGRSWLVPIWVTVLVVLVTLILDRLLLPPHRLTSSTDIAPLLALGTARAALFLALTALVSLGAGLLLGVVLRRGLVLGALLGGAVVAFAHLSVADLTPMTALVVLAHPLLWLVGTSVAGRWTRR